MLAHSLFLLFLFASPSLGFIEDDPDHVHEDYDFPDDDEGHHHHLMVPSEAHAVGDFLRHYSDLGGGISKELMVARNIDGDTMLHLAARAGDVASLDLMLANGANPNIGGGSRNLTTPLHQAMATSPRDSYLTATSLVNGGAKVNALDNDESRRTPLHLAAAYGNAHTASLLITHGANLEAKDGMGMTPLFHAVFGDSLEAVKLLLERGANARARDHRNLTPVDVATHPGRAGSKNARAIASVLNSGYGQQYASSYHDEL